MYIKKILFIAILLATYNTTLLANSVVTLENFCGRNQQLLVVSGEVLPELVGATVDRITVFKWSGAGLEAVPFQIDQKDEDNRYIMPATDNAKTSGETSSFDSNDEIALLIQDAGERITKLPEQNGQDSLMALEIKNPGDAVSRWLYFKKNAAFSSKAVRSYINYSISLDTVSTETFQLGFSKETPFLIDTFNWRAGFAAPWSPDIADVMKIRHTGKLFGFIDFERNAADYHSELIAVKQGPMRIIRRTENKVSMFWKLKSPSVLVDYVITPDGFTMDMIIDIPFRVGLFFSDLVTMTTMDWNSSTDLPVLTIRTDTQANDLVVDGKMSADKIAFNGLAQNTFGIDSHLGKVQMTLTIPDDFPITSRLYLRDDLSEADAPEQDTGQFGNVGFTTTGWENINTEVHHMEFKACLSRHKVP